MTAIEPLCHLIDLKSPRLTREEHLFLEADLFARLCEELKKNLRIQFDNYFLVMKFTIEKEDNMLETYFTRLIMKDILLTEEYTLEGIALYTHTHKEVVEEIYFGINTTPSALFLRRLIELHRMIRKPLYRAIIKKIIADDP